VRAGLTLGCVDGWEERAAEARRLAHEVGQDDADSRLLALLLDRDDTSVSQSAAEALLDRRDRLGLRLYAKAFGQAAEDTRNKLGDCLYDDSGERWGQVERLLPGLSDDADEQVRSGADGLRQRMRAEAQSHLR
jgi:hypothetical protein